MNRRGFLTSLGALASSAVLPKAPSIPLQTFIDVETQPFKGGQFVFYADSDGIVTTDHVSAYPHSLYGAGSIAAMLAYNKAWKLKDRS